MNNHNPTIQADKLSFYYSNKCALEGVSFTLKQGEFVALLGPNGAGKTTLFSLLSQFIKTSTGSLSYHINGQALQGRKALKHIGFVFQQPTLDLDLSVGQNLHYHAALHGLNKKTATPRIEQELTRLNMLERLHDKVRSLNGGHRRRVEIARALLHKPSILLLDEPTVGIDMQTRELLNLHIRQLCKEQNITTLWTTHMIDEINADDEIIMLHQGKIHLQGRCQKLMNEHESDNLRDLFFNPADLNQS